jgi:hypothetical protein
MKKSTVSDLDKLYFLKWWEEARRSGVHGFADVLNRQH